MPHKRRRKGKLRISLLSAILLLTIASLGGALFHSWRANTQLRAEFAPIKAENERLRAEGGGLTIDDPNNVHVIKVPETRDSVWIYRVYLPEGPEYYVGVLINKLPSRPEERPRLIRTQDLGFNIVKALSDSALQMGHTISPGEHLLTVAVDSHQDESATVSLFIDNFLMGSSRRTRHWPAEKWGSDLAASESVDEQIAISPNSLPLILRRERHSQSGAVSIYRAEDGSDHGFIFWIDRTDEELPTE